MTRHGSVRLAWSLVCAAVITLAMWFVTRSGALLTPDSLSYVGAAHALRDHGALRVPVAKWNDADSTTVLQQFPPGYPVVLAVALRAGATPDTVVRVVSAVSSFALVAILVWLCSAATDDWWPARVAAPLLILAVRAIPTAWASAWSEPLSLVALALTLQLMVMHPRKSWAYGITAAAGNAVRYAGVSLLLAATLWAAWRAYRAPNVAPGSVNTTRQRVARTLRAALFAAAPGVMFNAWWLWRAQHYGVKTPVATVAWMGSLSSALDEGVQTIAAQMVPLVTGVPSWVRVDVAVVLLAFVVLVLLGSLSRFRREARLRVMMHLHTRSDAYVGAPYIAPSDAHERSYATACACFTIAGSYAAMLVYSRLFVGASIPLDDRLLAPLVLTMGIATLVALHYSLFGESSTSTPLGASLVQVTRQVTPSTRGRARLYIAAACWLGAACWQSYADVASLLEDRDDYGSEYWTGTEAAEWMRTSGKTHALYSNDPVATYFITGRPSRTVPDRFSRSTATDFLMRLRASNGVLIEYPKPLEDMVDARELARQVGMCIVVSSEVGNVWRLPTSAMERCADGVDTVRSSVVPSPSSPILPAPVRRSP